MLVPPIPEVPAWHTSIVFNEDSASLRVVKTLLPPTIVMVEVVGRCSAIWQRFVVASWTI